MKVLHVNVTLDAVGGGGTAERVFCLCKHLKLLGVENLVLTTSAGLTPGRIAVLQPSRIIALPLLSRRFYLPAPYFSVVRRAVAECDVVHIMNHWTLINLWAFYFARRLGRPHVVCPAGAIPAFGRSRRVKVMFDRMAGRKLISSAVRGIAIAASEKEAFAAYGLSWERVVVIPNGVDLPPSDFVRPAPGIGGRQYLLFLGRLSQIKGPDLLLHAFLRIAARFGELDLVFAGPDDGMEGKLRQIAAASPYASRVRFTGFIGGTAKQDLLAAATLLVVPSRREAMSIVALEAGVLGTPVLMTDQCGFNQICDHGGEIVPASDTALAERLIDLLADPSQLRRRGEQFMRFVWQEYSWRKAAERHLQLFRDVIAAGPRS